jgi:branched-chain amino acid transport system permease protein
MITLSRQSTAEIGIAGAIVAVSLLAGTMDQTIAGLAIAGLLVFIALGLSMTFGLVRIVNFAHGAVFMLGGVFTSVLLTRFPDFPGDTWLSMLVLAPLGCVLVGFVIHSIIETIRDRSGLTFIMHSLLISFALFLIIVELTEIVFSHDIRVIDPPYPLAGTVQFAGLQIGAFRLFIVAMTVVVVGILWYVIQRTQFGLTVQAAIYNPSMTSALGHDIHRVRQIVFGGGSYLAGVGGAMYTTVILVSPETAITVILSALLVTVIGGMGSFWGVIPGAAIIGLSQSYAASLGMSGATLVFPFVVVMVVLLIRPQGLYGRESE